MTDRQTSVARDPAKPPEYYLQCAALLAKNIQSIVEKNEPKFYVMVADYYVRTGRALYSAGEPPAKCMGSLADSSKYLLSYFRDGTGGTQTGLAQFEEYLEWFGAADLVGRAREIVDAFRGLKLTGVEPWQAWLMAQLCAALAGEPVVQKKADVETIQRIKPYVDLPALFRALSEGDVEASGTALDAFLTKSWGPSADRAAKADLKKPYPVYTGKWSFFSAAVCRRRRTASGLSKKAMQYLPVELLSP